MQIIIEILKVIIFLSWTLFLVYTFFRLKRDMRALDNKYNLIVPFECKKCHTVFDYPYDTYLKIIKKVRNDYQARFGSGIHRSKEFKYLCEKCGSKQWQRQMRLYPFSGSIHEPEYRSLFVRTMAKVFVVSLLVPLCMFLLSAI